MANKQLFSSAVRGKTPPVADATNSHGAPSYSVSNEEKLAQYIATGTLSNTFYATAEDQLDKILELAASCSAEFVAKAALYSRESAFLKDAPALLLAHLFARKDGGTFAKQVFSRVCDNPRVLRTFVQIVRSGKTGRKSLGTAPKRMIQNWFDARTDDQVFRSSIGNDPSLADVIRMVHPKPATPSRAALYAYLIGKKHEKSALPALVQAYESWKDNAGENELPDVPFLMLSSANLTGRQWQQAALKSSWTNIRMNLNTFARHGVFANSDVVASLAKRLADPAEIQRSKVFPYQLMVAYETTKSTAPRAIQNALQDAMEVATKNIPQFAGRNGEVLSVAVFLDISSSMQTPVTGARGSVTTAVDCNQVAALFAAAIARVNPLAEIIPFHSVVQPVVINSRDSVMTITEGLSRLPTGGTSCSAPMLHILKQRKRVDLVIYLSDNESWMDERFPGTAATMAAWEQVRAFNPGAKLVCIDMAPNLSRTAPTRKEIMNIGGFSDTMFSLIADFARGDDCVIWVNQISAIKLAVE